MIDLIKNILVLLLALLVMGVVVSLLFSLSTVILLIAAGVGIGYYLFAPNRRYHN